MRLLILLLTLTLGCAEGSGAPVEPDQPDSGSDVGPNNMEDMGTSEDTGNNPVPDMPPDMTPEPGPTVQTTFMPSGGGGESTTTQHQLRIVVGAPSPAGELRTNQHHIQLGVGSAQHGQ